MIFCLYLFVSFFYFTMFNLFIQHWTLWASSYYCSVIFSHSKFCDSRHLLASFSFLFFFPFSSLNTYLLIPAVIRVRGCSQSAGQFESWEGGRRKGPRRACRSFSCLICCKAAAAGGGEVAGHPASRNRRNFVLTYTAGSALREGNASTALLLGESADYTARIVKPPSRA